MLVVFWPVDVCRRWRPPTLCLLVTSGVGADATREDFRGDSFFGVRPELAVWLVFRFEIVICNRDLVFSVADLAGTVTLADCNDDDDEVAATGRVYDWTAAKLLVDWVDMVDLRFPPLTTSGVFVSWHWFNTALVESKGCLGCVLAISFCNYKNTIVMSELYEINARGAVIWEVTLRTCICIWSSFSKSDLFRKISLFSISFCLCNNTCSLACIWFHFFSSWSFARRLLLLGETFSTGL